MPGGKRGALMVLAAISGASGGKVIGVPAGNTEDAFGINSRFDLARAGRIINTRTNGRLMAGGVSIIDPDNTYIDGSVSIGRDTVIHPGNHITGDTKIGEGCTLMPGCIIDNCTIGDGVTIKPYSVLEKAVVEQGAAIGPFAHLRPGSVVGKDARVGNFVELKKTELALYEKTEELNRFFTVVMDLLCIIDSTTKKILYVNEAWKKTFGYTIKEIINTPYTDFVHPDDLTSTQNAALELIKKQVLP